MIAANQPPTPDEPSKDVGQGLSPGEERELRAHARLYHRAIKAGWNITRSGRKRVIDEMMTAVEQGELDTKIAAARTIIAADSVNVQREKMLLTQPPSTTVNVAVGVQVIEDDAWYGNDAHGKAAQATAASDAGAAGPQSVQGGGLRSAMGKNGNGAANGHKGARGDEGDVSGGH